MTWRRFSACGLLVALCGLGGCAALGKAEPVAPPPQAEAGTTSVAASPEKQGLRVQIEAPDELKALLEKHLDIVRLGRMARADVDDSEWARLLEASPAQAKDLLQTEGYFAPKIDVVPDADTRNIVRLRVDPGPRARVTQLTLLIEGELERSAANGDALAKDTLEAWRRSFGLREGSDFRNPAWSDAKSAALAVLRAAGYANVAWAGTNAEVDTEAHTVRLYLVADSGPLFRYGSLQIEGLVAHDSETVSHLMNAGRGVPVTETLLLDFQERLQKSGLFEGASVMLDTDAAQAANAAIVVKLREAPLQVYTFGVGISANTGPRASVEHIYRRVFGYAASSRNKIEWGQKRQFWEGEISTHPGENLYRNLIGGTIENLESDTDTVLSQRLRLGRTQDTQRIERLYYTEAERSRTVTIAGNRTNAYALSLNYHGVWRDLDSVILPTQGFSFAGQVGVGRSSGTNASPGIFTRVYARLTGYLPLGRTWYSQARVELGHVYLRENMVVPDSQKFRAGGDDSVRGYGYRSLGPVVDGLVTSGTSTVTASVEVARPFLQSMPTLWLAWFIDAGNAANSFAALKPVYGTGVGLRWRSPVGPLRLDWAWGAETRKSRLHFSVGIAF
ncbi:MAG: BamA/TamA family outer membrane protein [Rubrivivax sp.]|nr:BamA/TamA family outer membrane protein [Rubrivivax sp.]